MLSHNVFGADNQQERLETVGWVVGFVDGEGCFATSIFRNTKSRLKMGMQVFPEFVVTQGARSLGALKKVQKFFGCGAIYKNRRHDNHREDLYKFAVRPLKDLDERIIPFFRRHPLKTAKRLDFRIFERVVKMMLRKRHLTAGGLQKIQELVKTANTRKYR